jgi:hypothetical protein
MKRMTFAVSLVTLGLGLWLSSRVVDTHPAYAVAAGLATLTFSAFAVARPSRSEG